MEYTGLIISILCVLFILAGVVMTIMGLPGNTLILLTGLAYGYYDHFDRMDYAVLVIVFGIFIIGEIIEFISGLIGAKKEKASKRAIFAPFIGTIVGGIGGTAVLPIIGSLLGALLGAFIVTVLAEYSKTKDLAQARKVAKSVVKGQIFGVIIKSAAAVGMAILLIYQLKWQ
ncbi:MULTISPECIES: DUF456 domain-containing protein [Pelosinus]|uniref:DUF456 domain-containing protein n=1 Tax=Pelosinus fermentans B4 TaxID=1149862 RepID=I8RM66_9FIRM|nr:MULTISPECIES: DUF456 domain-containing protein [Pelosinus]EIW19845.1 protein of unknown function DUF456 [Pelosinus fermentans B4]EIW21298.1 protein of unknown function DUF456 [Pelosinus fermentans A11]